MSSSVGGSPAVQPKFTTAEKRAVHNALERKRRDHIKDMFSQLKESVPNLAGEKVSVKASRAQILKKACDYLQMMRRKNQASAKDLDLLNQQISRTKKQIAKLESIRNTNRYVAGLSPTQTGSSPQPFLDPQQALPSQTSSIQTSSGESSPIYASHQQIISMVSSMGSINAGGIAYPPGMIPVRLEDFNMMGRLPPMNSLQRIYASDISGQNNNGYGNVCASGPREGTFVEPFSPQSNNSDRG